MLHAFPRAARWHVLHAPDRYSSKETQTENRPRPVAQWEQGGSFTLPRDAIRHALLVCTRSLCVDFSGGSSFPGYHGIGLTSGSPRNLSMGSIRELRRPVDVRLPSRPSSLPGLMAAAKGGRVVLLRACAYSGSSRLATMNSSLSNLGGILLLFVAVLVDTLATSRQKRRRTTSEPRHHRERRRQA